MMNQSRSLIAADDTPTQTSAVRAEKLAAAVEGALERVAHTDAVARGSEVPALVEQLQMGDGDTAIAKDLFPLMASLLVHVLAVDRRLAREALMRRLP
jgi:hypothetical protein